MPGRRLGYEGGGVSWGPLHQTTQLLRDSVTGSHGNQLMLNWRPGMPLTYIQPIWDPTLHCGTCPGEKMLLEEAVNAEIAERDC